MNWGGFAGGFSQGFNNGVQMGKTFKEALKQKQIDDVRAKGMEEANAARGLAIDGMIRESGLNPKPADAVTAGTTVPTDSLIQNPEKGSGAMVTPVTDGAGNAPANQFAHGLQFDVGGKGFATREEARKAAEQKAPGVMEFLSKTMVPKMQEAYIAQGNVEMAEAWGKWAEEKDNKAAMREWASAMRASQIGNFEKAADHVFNLYKRYDDGITPVSKETVKDKDGNITGFNVRLKNDESGEEYEQFIDRKSLTEMGLSALAPPQLFEAQFKRQMEADKIGAQAAADEAKDSRRFQRDVAMERMKQTGRLEEIGIKNELDNANIGVKEKRLLENQMQMLRQNGYSEEDIRAMVPAMLRIGEHKKTTDPTERRALVVSDLTKNVPMFASKPKAERDKMVDEMMEMIYGGQSQKAPAAAGGLPQSSPQQRPQAGKTPIYDTKTGQVVYR